MRVEHKQKHKHASFKTSPNFSQTLSNSHESHFRKLQANQEHNITSKLYQSF